MHRHHYRGTGQRLIQPFGFVSDRSGAAGNGVLYMIAPVMLQPRHRQEQVATTNLAAVERQLADQDVAAGVWQQVIQWHRHQLRPPLPLAASAVCSSAGGGRLSGATFIRRSARAMTLPNTGAATRPP